MTLPDYIDNQNFKLEDILRQIIEDEKQITLDIATGYFRIEAWLNLELAFNKLTSLRLLIGQEPDQINLIQSETVNFFHILT